MWAYIIRRLLLAIPTLFASNGGGFLHSDALEPGEQPLVDLLCLRSQLLHIAGTYC